MASSFGFLWFEEPDIRAAVQKSGKEAAVMEWILGRKIEEQLILEFEKAVNYRFPDAFRRCALENDGAYAEPDVFDTACSKEQAIKCLCSFGKDSRESIWVFPEFENEELEKRYVIFAGDNFGNHICFDRKDDSVVFIDHETEEVEFVAPSFTAFEEMLYEDED